MTPGAPRKLGEQHYKGSLDLSGSDFSPWVTGMLISKVHWQLEVASTGEILVDDDSAALTDITVNNLTIGVQYLARVRYRADDGTWSSWSPDLIHIVYGEPTTDSSTPAGGVYPTTPQILQPFEETITFRTLIAGGAGKEQRDTAWTAPKRLFRLTYGALTKTDCDTLWDFYDSQKGTYGTFTFVNPLDSVSYTVRFKNDTMSRKIFDDVLTSTGLEMIEVL